MANANPPATVPDGTVSTQVSADGIGVIEFHHPKGNSLPGALLRALADAISAMGQDPAVRVIGLRSAGSGPFCAGASFDELVAIDDEARGQAFFSGFSRVILAMIRAPKFVVTRVHGRAAGGAVGVIAASDYAIASAKGALKLSELAVGIGPFVVGPVIAHKIGLAAFSQMAVDADWRDAAWAPPTACMPAWSRARRSSTRPSPASCRRSRGATPRRWRCSSRSSGRARSTGTPCSPNGRP